MKNRNMLQKWLIILFLGLIIQAVSAQNINVHGIITDETGETMIGVSVLVKGTSTGVVTDVNGNFRRIVFCRFLISDIKVKKSP